MAGRWLVTTAVDKKALTADSLETIDLPKSNFIGHIEIRVRNVGGTTPTLNITSFQVVANGSAMLWDMDGEQQTRMQEWEFGGDSGGELDAVGTTTAGIVGTIWFGRWLHDTEVILPAKVFRTLQLKMNFDLGGTSPDYDYYVYVHEYVSDDAPTGKLLQKTTETEEKASASGVRDFDLPLGNIYRRLFLQVGTAPTLDVKYDISVRVNNGAEIPFSGDYEVMTEQDLQHRNLAAEITTLTAVNFDYDMTLRDTKDSALFNDFKLRIASGSDATTANAITQELIRLA